MARATQFRRTASFCIVILLGACATQFTDDLTVQSVELVEGPSQDAWTESGLVPVLSTESANVSRSHSEQPGPVLKVTLATKSNLWAFAKRKAGVMQIDADFCDTSDNTALLRASSLYVPQAVAAASALNAEATAASPYEYFFFMDIRGDARETEQVTYQAFDLIAQPRDVCVVIRGGYYSKIGYKSNTAVVSALAIKAALRDLPLAAR